MGLAGNNSKKTLSACGVMKKMKLYFKTATLTAIVVFLFIVSFAVGFTITLERWKVKSEKDIKGKNVTQIAYINKDIESRIADNTLFVVRKYFKGCGHVIEEKKIVPKEYVGMSKQDFKNMFAGWEIDAFSSKYVVISRVFEGFCPNHFIISIKDGRVAIFYSQPVDGDTLKLITPISIENLPEQEVNDLKKGIVVNSFEDAIKIIEDFGS